MHHQSLESLYSTKTPQFTWAWPENSSQQRLGFLLLTADPLLQTSWGLIVTLPLKLLSLVAMRLTRPWNYRFIQCSCLIPIGSKHGFSLSCWNAFSKGFLQRRHPHSQPCLLFYHAAWWKHATVLAKGRRDADFFYYFILGWNCARMTSGTILFCLLWLTGGLASPILFIETHISKERIREVFLWCGS